MKILIFISLLLFVFSCSNVNSSKDSKLVVTKKQTKVPLSLYPMPKKYDFNSKDTYNSYTCSHCHEIMDNKFKHKAAEVSCLSCHVQHGKKTQYDFMLRRRVNTTCFLCHNQETLHQNNQMIANHPIIGKTDPFDKNKKFSCTSCHAIHSSNMKNLFRYNYSEETPYKGNLCAVCHWSTVYDDHEPKKPEAY